MGRASHPAFGPRAAALSRDPVRTVGRPTRLGRDSRTYFLMVLTKTGLCIRANFEAHGRKARNRQKAGKKKKGQCSGNKDSARNFARHGHAKTRERQGPAVTRVTRVTRRRVTNVTRVTRARPKRASRRGA